jgi:hypothetical protein
MYKNKCGELVFKNEGEYRQFYKKYTKIYEKNPNAKQMRCNGVRIHIDEYLDMLLVARKRKLK